MTATASTAPTNPLPPAEAAHAAGSTSGRPPAAENTTPPGSRAPWYRRAWVIPVAAVLVAALSFGSGFIAGNAASLFRVLGGPGASVFDGGSGAHDRLPGDGGWPGAPREQGSTNGEPGVGS